MVRLKKTDGSMHEWKINNYFIRGIIIVSSSYELH